MDKHKVKKDDDSYKGRVNKDVIYGWYDLIDKIISEITTI